ncbi:MAG TPA: hypothetical protein DCY20_01290 [Firmicutes bacterium]|nr:hypothetical protein [Bacillota bacterium]
MITLSIGIILCFGLITFLTFKVMDAFKTPVPEREFSYSEFTMVEEHQISIGDYQAAVELSESGAYFFLDVSQGDEFVDMIGIPMIYFTFLETQTEDLGFYYLVVGDTGGVYVRFYDLEQQDEYVVSLEKEVMDQLIAQIDLNK